LKKILEIETFTNNKYYLFMTKRMYGGGKKVRLLKKILYCSTFCDFKSFSNQSAKINYSAATAQTSAASIIVLNLVS